MFIHSSFQKMLSGSILRSYYTLVDFTAAYISLMFIYSSFQNMLSGSMLRSCCTLVLHFPRLFHSSTLLRLMIL